MEEYFAEGTIPEQHLITALHEAIREDRIFPVLFTSGEANMATDHLLDFIKVYAPAPIERLPIPVTTAAMQAVANGNGGGAGVVENAEPAGATRKVDDGEPTAADGVQDHVRSVCGTHHLLQGRQRRGEERRDAGELHAARTGAAQPPERDAGPQGSGSRRSCTLAIWARWPSCARPLPATRWARRARTFRSN